MGKVFKSNTLLLILDPEVAHQKINVELMKNIYLLFLVKYQESRIRCENLAYFQFIENKCKLNIMTKIYLGNKRQIGSIK